MKYSLKLGKASLHRYYVGQKVCQIRSIWHGFRDTSIFVFCNFSMERLVFTDTLWIKLFAEITLSIMVFEIQTFLCFVIFAKNLKIQNGHHFLASEIFTETWKS